MAENSPIIQESFKLTTQKSIALQTGPPGMGPSITMSAEGAPSIEIKVGQNSIKIDAQGVAIQGMKLSLQGQIQLELKGAIVQVSGDGMLQLKGGIVMLN